MALQQTLSIIKPDATRRNLTGKLTQKSKVLALKLLLKSDYN